MAERLPQTAWECRPSRVVIKKLETNKASYRNKQTQKKQWRCHSGQRRRGQAEDEDTGPGATI